MTHYSNSEKETQKIAGELAAKIKRGSTSSRRASIITLEGELGAGKTTFVKGFAVALGVKEKVKSPTFNLMKQYPIFANGWSLMAGRYLYHLDCYRVRDHKDLATLDLRSLFKSPDNIVLIEWPERVSKILPKNLIKVHIDHIDKNKRRIQIYRK